jgi:poly [ADP-ribose] polymerase
MAPATRGKRAAQSPPTDAEPAPAKQPRKTNARGRAKVEPVDEDQLDTSEPEEKKPAPRKGRSKVAVKAEPEDDEQDDVAEAKPAPKKGKAKAAAPKADSAELEDKKPAPKKARGKATVKDEPAEDEQVDSTEPAKDEKNPEMGKEAQLAKAGTTQIPLDEGCHLTQYHVYVDSDSLIYDASLNQTNASGNNNKFYRIQVSRIAFAH